MLTKLLQAQLTHTLQTGKRPAIPEEAGPLWNAFCDLSAARGTDFGAPNPITYLEIDAWCRVMRQPLDPRHVRAIVALDRTWLNHGRAEADKPGSGKPNPSRPISVELFDAIIG